MKIGILGGTFNPVHFGHLAAAEEVCDRLALDRVLFIPSSLPPHKEKEAMPSAAEREEMVRLAVSGNSRFLVSDLETKRGGRSYTVDTIRELRTAHEHDELFFITGLDSFLEIRTWKDWKALLSLCTFVVISREGRRFSSIEMSDFLTVDAGALRKLDAGTIDRVNAESGDVKIIFLAVPFYEISSTDIRARIRDGRSIKYHLPASVERYIIDRNIYAERTRHRAFGR